MAAHQASPSLGFSRQEYWSGLPFPSPMQESEKWKWSHSVVSDWQRPHGLQPTRLLYPRIFQQEYWSGVPLPCTMDKGKYSKWAIIILLYSRHLLIPMQAREICMCAVLSLFSHIWLFAPPWTVALQDPLSMGFSRQKYWSGFPCSTPGERKS